MDASALDVAISALEKEISGFEASADGLDFWLKVWTAAVVIGVALELVIVIREYIDARIAWRRASISSPESPAMWFFIFQLAATLLITTGVTGELWVGALSGRVNSKLRDKSRQLVASVQEKAGNAEHSAADAQERAAANEREAADLRRKNLATEYALEQERKTRLALEKSLAPRTLLVIHGRHETSVDSLKPFAGFQAFIEFISEDTEARRAAEYIAGNLKAAGWKVPPIRRSATELPDAVWIRPYTAALDKWGTLDPEVEMWEAARNASSALADFLEASNWDRPFEADDIGDKNPVPPKSIKILVGLKPMPYFGPIFHLQISSATDKESRERAERVRRLRDRISELRREVNREAERPFGDRLK